MKMRDDTTIIIRADVYTQEIPSMSDSLLAISGRIREMYSSNRGNRRPKKETGSKKQYVRNWLRGGQKKHKQPNLFAVIMSPEDSPSPVQASISSELPTGFDVLDDVRLGKMTPSPTTSTKTSKPADNETPKFNDHETPDTDVEAIEEAMPIVRKTLPVPEPTPKIQRNGLDAKKPVHELEEPDACLISCIYYTQQCCSCTIV